MKERQSDLEKCHCRDQNKWRQREGANGSERHRDGETECTENGRELETQRKGGRYQKTGNEGGIEEEKPRVGRRV